MTNDPITQLDLANAVQNAGLAVQVAELIKDMGALNLRMDQHEKRHESEAAGVAADKQSARRFRITITLAAGATLSGMLALLVDIAYHVH